MKIRKFQAETMAEALRRAKDAFGPDALILSARTIQPSGGFLGKWKRPQVEITAAAEGPMPAAAAGSPVPKGSGSAASPGRPLPEQGADRLHRDPAPRQPIQTFADALTGAQKRTAIPESMIRKLFWLHQQLVIEGVEEDVILALLQNVLVQASDQKGTSDHTFVQSFEDVVSRAVPPPSATAAADGQQRWVFLGPTGVGKTTTIAKIAAIRKFHQKESVALITLDEQRIGGISQLATYARIFKIAMKAPRTPAGLAQAVQQFSDRKLLLIDTAGLNPSDRQSMQLMAGFLKKIEPTRNHLVLSATTKDTDLQHLTKGFAELSIQHLIFTKLDESATRGNLLNQLVRSGIPLSFWTNGRKIPEDIHVATPRRLTRMLLNDRNTKQAKTASPEQLAERMAHFEALLAGIKTKPVRTYTSVLERDLPKTPVHPRMPVAEFYRRRSFGAQERFDHG